MCDTAQHSLGLCHVLPVLQDSGGPLFLGKTSLLGYSTASALQLVSWPQLISLHSSSTTSSGLSSQII